jgi:hypothetical protein
MELLLRDFRCAHRRCERADLVGRTRVVEIDVIFVIVPQVLAIRFDMHPALRLLQILPDLRFLALLGCVIVKPEAIFVCLLTRIVVRDRIDDIVNHLRRATRLAPRHTWMTFQYVTTAHTRPMLVGIIDQTLHSFFFLYRRAVQLDHHQAVERLDVHTVSRLALDVVHAAKTTLTTNTAELEDEHGADKVAQTTT